MIESGGAFQQNPSNKTHGTFQVRETEDPKQTHVRQVARGAEQAHTMVLHSYTEHDGSLSLSKTKARGETVKRAIATLATSNNTYLVAKVCIVPTQSQMVSEI